LRCGPRTSSSSRLSWRSLTARATSSGPHGTLCCTAFHRFGADAVRAM
jgi:hypothetical protein